MSKSKCWVMVMVTLCILVSVTVPCGAIKKVIEEAPGPGISAEMRSMIGNQCVQACKMLKYKGVGTFEFLFEDGQFYFIEMNTYIQVEHPVTELIAGLI